MQEPRQPAGPTFLPYPLPLSLSALPTPALDEPYPWPGDLTTDAPVPRWVSTSIGLATVALVGLLALSLALHHRGWGALLTVLPGAGAIAVFWRRRSEAEALTPRLRGLVQATTSAAAAAIVIALVLLALPGSPQPAVSAATAPDPFPGPNSVQPFLPPPSGPVAGEPTQPGPPLSTQPTDTGLLTGRVTDSSAQPVPGARITVTRSVAGDTSDSPTCPLRTTAVTDRSGRYRLPLCQLGDGLGYSVTISAGGSSTRADLFVNAGQTTVYDVVLPLRHA